MSLRHRCSKAARHSTPLLLSCSLTRVPPVQPAAACSALWTSVCPPLPSRVPVGLLPRAVRGAYMVLERQRAQDLGYPSPIHDTAADTHANYNE